MKKTLITSIIFLSLLTFTTTLSYAKQQELTEECKQMIEETRQEYSKLVMQELLHSFKPFKEKNESEYIYFNARDLWKSQLLVGKSDAFDSLKNLMSGSFRGEKRVYFIQHKPNTAYIIYKNINNKNVMETITRGKDEWVFTDKEVKQGKDIFMEPITCKDEHFMQKMFDNLYP